MAGRVSARTVGDCCSGDGPAGQLLVHIGKGHSIDRDNELVDFLFPIIVLTHVEVDLAPLDGTCREWSMVISEGEGQPCLERQREMAHARRVLPTSCGPHTTGIARCATPNKTINLLKT